MDGARMCSTEQAASIDEPQAPIQPLGSCRIRYEKETRLKYLVSTIPKIILTFNKLLISNLDHLCTPPPCKQRSMTGSGRR